MAGISSIGLSGLPLTQLLQDLQKNENQALAVIKSRQTAAESKVSSYGKLKDSIASFQKAAEAVGKTDAFGSIAAKAGSDAFSVSTTNKAIAGQYSIQVDSLAAAQTLVYGGQGSRTDAIGTDGQITFTVNGEEKTLDLAGKDTSLDGLVKAINSNPDLGVNATIVNNGTNGSQYQLLLTNRDTGTEAAVSKIQVDGNTEPAEFSGVQQRCRRQSCGIRRCECLSQHQWHCHQQPNQYHRRRDRRRHPDAEQDHHGSHQPQLDSGSFGRQISHRGLRQGL